MCEGCGCEVAEKPIQYECVCEEDGCNCSIIEFDEGPRAVPYCCGVPMRRIK